MHMPKYDRTDCMQCEVASHGMRSAASQLWLLRNFNTFCMPSSA